MVYRTIALLILALTACSSPAPTPSARPPASVVASTQEATEGELLTKALLFDGDQLEICMDNVQALAERVVGEPVWTTEQRERARDYLAWFEEHC